MPFMKLGIAILYKAPDTVPPTLFAFLDPFSGTLWISIALAYVLVSITLFIVSRLANNTIRKLFVTNLNPPKVYSD